MFAAATYLMALSAQVEPVEYEMVEVVLPRPSVGYSHCADINDKGVAIAMSGGQEVGLTGGVGTVTSWVWANDEVKRVKGFANFVRAVQIESDGTIGCLVPFYQEGYNDWRPGYLRGGKTYQSPLSVPNLPFVKPYDHSGGLSGILALKSTEVELRQTGTTSVTPKSAPRSNTPGGKSLRSAEAVSVPTYAGNLVNRVVFMGGVDKDGDWAAPPVTDQLVTFSNHLGGKVAKVHNFETLARPKKTFVTDWRIYDNGEPRPVPFDQSSKKKVPDADSFAHYVIWAYNDQKVITFSIESDLRLPSDLPEYRTTDASEVNMAYANGRVMVTGAYICDSKRVTRIPDFDGMANYPLALNERNDVCGTMANKQSVMRGFLLRHGITYDLNTVTFDRHGWTISSANAINDKGWIAATGYKNRKYAAFVLRPLERGTIRRVARIASGAVYDGVVSAKVDE